MTKATTLALCSALAFAPSDDGAVPEWVHLLPAGGTVTTVDGRGPYKVEDYHALMAASLPAGEKLVLDENHATDLAAPKGLPAPAAGWITELQFRADSGVWGKVEWTEAGRKLAPGYRGISPAIVHRKDKTVLRIARASLVNQPNLEGLTALHAEENDMDFKAQIRAALGLAEDADDDAIVAAARNVAGGTETAVQAALAPIAAALDLDTDGDLVGAITTLQAQRGAGDDDAITALQSELTAVTSELAELRGNLALQAATAFVDGAIAEGRVGVKPLRDRYIAMHQKDPTGTEELINAMPKVGGRVSLHQQGDPTRRTAELDEADRGVIALMGLNPEEFKKTRQAELGVEEEAL